MEELSVSTKSMIVILLICKIWDVYKDFVGLKNLEIREMFFFNFYFFLGVKFEIKIYSYVRMLVVVNIIFLYKWKLVLIVKFVNIF